MIIVKSKSLVETLRKLSIEWKADFVEGQGMSRLELDNEIGKGHISSYDLMPGIGAITYNIIFNSEVVIKKVESDMLPIYFYYCLEGHIHHKFKSEDDSEKVAQYQNVYISSTEHTENIFILPKGIKLKISSILVMPKEFGKLKKHKKFLNAASLQNIISSFENETSFKYSGKLNTAIADIVSVLIKNTNTDTVGRLTIEAAVLNILAKQLEIFQTEKYDGVSTSLLNSDELDTMISLYNYIANNISQKLTIKELAAESGLSPKKMQIGTNFLYGMSLNNFIKNLRLEYAKELMETTNMTISEITYSVGLNSRGYFSKIFKDRYGVLPKDYGKNVPSDLPVFELSYRSKVSDNTTVADINDILETSRINNKKYNITGCLFNYKDFFFQVIEGDKEVILQLYEKIKEDRRHYDVSLIWKGAKVQRSFAEWNLAVVSDKGDFNIDLDGIVRHIDMEDLLGDDTEQTVSTEILWSRVRNILKVKHA